MNVSLDEPERIQGAVNPTEEVFVIMNLGFERRKIACTF